MSEIDVGIKAHRFLFDAMCKRAWGESLDICDMADLLDELRPAFGGAIGAVDDRNQAVGILFELHEKLRSSGPETISLLFRASTWAGSTSALADVCAKAVGHAGVAALDLLMAALTDEDDVEGAADLVFETCRFAVHGLTGFEQRLAMLHSSYDKALRMTDDVTVADILREGRAIAARQDEASAVETLLDYYREAVVETSGDPWSFLEVLAESLRAVTQHAADDETTLKQLMRILREMITDEIVESLWEFYEHRLDELGETEHVESLVKAYERTIHTVTDIKWLADRVFEVCDDIASARDDDSFWLPDRVQLSRACTAVVETVAGPAAAHSAISGAFELAICDAGEPWDVLAAAFRDVMTRADDEVKWRIASVMIRASQKAMTDVFSEVVSSAQVVIDDDERAVDVLLEAAVRESAFWAFQNAQEAAEGDRQRAVEWLLEALKGGTNRDRLSSADDPPEMSLFRAFMFAATALGHPSTAANLLATIYVTTQGESHGMDIEHALPHFVQVIAALEDPASEAEVMYDAYVAAITGGNDPGVAVEVLLEAARDAIARANDPAGAIRVLLSGLSVRPSGWPPPKPAWL